MAHKILVGHDRAAIRAVGRGNRHRASQQNRNANKQTKVHRRLVSHLAVVASRSALAICQRLAGNNLRARNGPQKACSTPTVFSTPPSRIKSKTRTSGKPCAACHPRRRRLRLRPASASSYGTAEQRRKPMIERKRKLAGGEARLATDPAAVRAIEPVLGKECAARLKNVPWLLRKWRQTPNDQAGVR